MMFKLILEMINTDLLDLNGYKSFLCLLNKGGYSFYVGHVKGLQEFQNRFFKGLEEAITAVVCDSSL